MSQVFETISVSNCDAAYIPRAGIATELRTVPWSIVTVKGSWFGLVLLLLLVLLVTHPSNHAYGNQQTKIEGLKLKDKYENEN